MRTLIDTSDYLYETIEQIKGKTGEKLFDMISEKNGKGLPLVAWKLSKAGDYDGGSRLHNHSWIWSINN